MHRIKNEETGYNCIYNNAYLLRLVSIIVNINKSYDDINFVIRFFVQKNKTTSYAGEK